MGVGRHPPFGLQRARVRDRDRCPKLGPCAARHFARFPLDAQYANTYYLRVMSRSAPTDDASADAETDRLAASVRRAERRMRVLEEIGEIGMRLMRKLEDAPARDAASNPVPTRCNVLHRKTWRPERESNSRARICSPLRHHSAIRPKGGRANRGRPLRQSVADCARRSAQPISAREPSEARGSFR